MKVLGIVGGPRRGGNTVRLVEAVLEGAVAAGHEAMLFRLCEFEIRHIEEREGGLHYPEDDMAKLYPHLEEMSDLVLGTPIYYDHVDSRLKQFIDRLHYYSETHGTEYRKRFPGGVKCVNVITYGWDRVDVYIDVLEWMKERMEGYWDMTVVGSLKAEGTGRRPVSERKDLLEKARELGRSF